MLDDFPRPAEEITEFLDERLATAMHAEGSARDYLGTANAVFGRPS
jgi:hypothetical protein